jgi:hypothetical protein
MAAHWVVTDDHLMSCWTDTGGMAGFHPEWMPKVSPREGRTRSRGVDMSTRSLFGGAKWYAHELRERDDPREK